MFYFIYVAYSLILYIDLSEPHTWIKPNIFSVGHIDQSFLFRTLTKVQLQSLPQYFGTLRMDHLKLSSTKSMHAHICAYIYTHSFFKPCLTSLCATWQDYWALLLFSLLLSPKPNMNDDGNEKLETNKRNSNQHFFCPKGSPLVAPYVEPGIELELTALQDKNHTIVLPLWPYKNIFIDVN